MNTLILCSLWLNKNFIRLLVCFYFISHTGGRVLQIPRAQAKDSGRYTCVAVNEAGEDSIQYDVRVLCEFNLSINLFLYAKNFKSNNWSYCLFVFFCLCTWTLIVPPSIRGADGDMPDEVTVLVNKTTLLECQVDGSPTPKISWTKDSQPLTPDNTHRLLSNGRTLQVRDKSTWCNSEQWQIFLNMCLFMFFVCVL